ncbi:hypothetical protein BT67DRAFT_314413 [Trichocladium antarcticum]|uniref:Uncharacterized protein n=1 Tax=Trichocladium antarcticum TaxID=1450529 RepID=A0AAN6UJS2_9PEZI|nr:hypothetical protein BT67DRAFT_314413 [Trichocladium antarcticum]
MPVTVRHRFAGTRDSSKPSADQMASAGWIGRSHRSVPPSPARNKDAAYFDRGAPTQPEQPEPGAPRRASAFCANWRVCRLAAPRESCWPLLCAPGENSMHAGGLMGRERPGQDVVQPQANRPPGNPFQNGGEGGVISGPSDAAMAAGGFFGHEIDDWQLAD